MNWKKCFYFSCLLAFILIFNQCMTGSRSALTKPLKLPCKKFVKPELVYVEGGSFVMGGYLCGNPYAVEVPPKRVNVTSFYISKFNISNRDYLVYLDDLKTNKKYREYKEAKINDKILVKNHSMVDFLKLYPYSDRFLDYPVIAVTPIQAEKYCKWLTEKERAKFVRNRPSAALGGVHEKVVAVPASNSLDDFSALKKESAKNVDVDGASLKSVDESSSKVVAEIDNVVDVEQNKNSDSKKKIDASMASLYDDQGNLINVDEIEVEFARYRELSAGHHKDFQYRLPTVAEWEFAAKATIIAQNEDGIETTAIGNYGNRFSSPRHQDGPNKGKLVGLFNLGSGLYKGPPGLNCNDAMTERIDKQAPNGIGVQGCYGNVWEMCYDEFSFVQVEADCNPVCLDESKQGKYDKSSPLSAETRVLKGGSYDSSVNELTGFLHIHDAATNVGFRVVAVAC